MNLDDFTRINSPAKAVEHPKGWHPYVEESAEAGSGVITTQDVPGASDIELRILQEADVDPEKWAAKNLSHRKWQTYDERWLHYWKFDLVLRHGSDEERLADIEELKQQLRQPASRSTGPSGGQDGFILVASDWQVGKGIGGGTEKIIERWLTGVELAKNNIADLRRRGYRLPTFALLATGDLHEQVCGFYAGQQFQVDLNKRDQSKVVRRMLLHAVEELAPLCDELILAAVGGNHGQASRQDYKNVTDDADNDDVAVFEVVEEVVKGRDGFDHVRFEIPNERLDICVDVAGVPVGLAHGHQFSGAGIPQAKALNWWKGQALGLQSWNVARIGLTSHFHHFSCVVHGLRTHIQTPTIDGGSDYYRDAQGMESPPGIVSLRVDPTVPLCWDNLNVMNLP